MHIHVEGSANNRRRIVRQQVKQDWKCPSCGAFNRYYWVNCPSCNHPRP